ncbi:hypothetical protein RBA41_16795 [Massilia sp. CCM 9210]|uniref:hypothetical protein n=1 Tax=Massilia scottii TaxID=3057166 RepID=UPI002796CC30|nr:hypothetical protein [Massilia sp. CCM 9210]MDQ1814968.1 hypothetical protein [Massilia sp. CCM 9210]
MKKYLASALFKSTWAAITLLSALALPPATAATPEEPQVANDIAAVRGQLAKAIIYIGPENWAFSTAKNESQLPSISCEYILTDADSLSTLMDILERGKFANHPPPYRMNVRMGIYLHRTDGAVKKILLNNPGLNAGMRGRYDEHTGVMSSPAFADELRAFAATRQQTKPNYYCDSDKLDPEKAASMIIPQPK